MSRCTEPCEVKPPFIRPFAEYDVWIGVFGSDRNSRVTIIKTAVVTRNDPWEKILNGRVILAGSVKADLTRLLRNHGRQSINRRTEHFTPGGVFTSGSTYDNLRLHLALTGYQHTLTNTT